MTTLIFDWSDWDGPASGHVVVTRRTWRRAPESLHVPWQVVLPVDGRATLDVAHVAGEAVSILWAPRRMASWTDHVLIPAGGEHLAHLLDRVDPSTLEPLPEDLPSAVDLVARAEALVARIESGEFRGADGDDGRGITSVEMVGASARFTWTDGTTRDVDLSALAGDDGDNGVGVESVTLEGTTLRFSLSDGTTRDVDAAALRGKDGHTPDLAWDGTRLVVDGVPGPSLKGESGDDGHTPVPTWQGTALSWDGGEAVDLRGASGQTPTIKVGTVTSGAAPSATIKGTSPDLTLDLVLAKGDPGTKGDTGAPGVVSSASSYVLVGPGRPDTPSTTGGVIPSPDTTPVGAEYRSTDGANVGAFVWMKRPGGKWEVTDGDTGWREITATAVDPSASQPGGRIFVRRLSPTLASIRIMGLAPLSADGVPVVETEWLPLGFRNQGVVMFYLTNIGRGESRGGIAARLPDKPWWKYARPLKINTTAAIDANGEVVFSTTDPWPSAPLPGNPA